MVWEEVFGEKTEEFLKNSEVILSWSWALDMILYYIIYNKDYHLNSKLFALIFAEAIQPKLLILLFLASDRAE